MSFTGNEDNSITLSAAAAITKNYRDSVTSGTTIGHYFGKSAIQAILNQTNCVGIRVYYAIDETGKKQLVITGVDSSENDLYTGLLADRSACCPTHCSTANPLNSNATS